MKSNEKKMILILLVILVVAIVIFFVVKNNRDKNQKAEVYGEENIISSYGIDVNDEAYAGKKIYTENGDLIIENEDGGKTIETKKQEQQTDLVATNQETKEKYEISNVKVNITGNRTSVTGSVKNNTKQSHKIIVQSKFYSNDNKVKGSGNVQIDEIRAEETKTFEIVIMGNMTGFSNQVSIEFTN